MKKSEISILIVHLLLYVAVGFDVPVLRPIIVFIYLTVVPGFVFLKILLKESSIVDTILYSVGLSITFVMFMGLLTNELYLVGFSQPLSAIPLTIALSLPTLVLLFLRRIPSWNINLNSAKKLIPKSAIFVLPPLLGIVGGLFINVPILILLIILIAILFAFSMFSNRFVPPKLYPIMIFSISLALLFHVLLTSKYIIGFDANLEFYVFSLTQSSGHWSLLSASNNPAATVQYNAMLSVTLLPAIYSSMSKISGDLIFKVLYPLIFALVPVAFYKVVSKQVGKSAALVSLLFVISGILAFYGLTSISLNRQIVAEFFLILSLLVLFNNEIPITKRRILLITFGAAIVVSHYSIMYIYLIYIFAIYAISKIKRDSDLVLNGPIVLLFSFITFLYYGLSGAPLNSLLNNARIFISNFFTDILSTSARSTEVFLTRPVSDFDSVFTLIIFLIPNFFVIVGLLGLVFKPQKIGLDFKFRIISIVNAIILILAVALPNFAPLNLSRFYAIILLLLSPFIVIGFGISFKITKKALSKVTGHHFSGKRFGGRSETSIVCILLICFLLTQVGFVNRVTNSSPIVRPLNLDLIEKSNSLQIETGFYQAYIPEQDVFGAVWLSSHFNSSLTIFADVNYQVRVLDSYGLIPLQDVKPLTDKTILEPGSYVYLGYVNTVNGLIILDSSGASLNTSSISPLFQQSNTIYSSGANLILYSDLSS